MWALERLGRLDQDSRSSFAAFVEGDTARRVPRLERIVAERERALGRDRHVGRSAKDLKDADSFVRCRAADALGATSGTPRPSTSGRLARRPTRRPGPGRGPRPRCPHGPSRPVSRREPVARRFRRRRPILRRTSDPRGRGSSASPTIVKSAAFLVRFLAKYPEDRRLLLAHLHHVARYGDASTDPVLLAFARSHEADDLGLQSEIVKAVYRGLQERGTTSSEVQRDGPRAIAEEAASTRSPTAANRPRGSS